jgi:hypothetical protein
MQSGFFAPLAVFLIFNFAFHDLLVLAGRVVHVLADGAAQANKLIGEFSLSHAKFVLIFLAQFVATKIYLQI